MYDASGTEIVAFSFEKSIEILLEGSGSHFGPGLLEMFTQITRPFFDKLSGQIIDDYFAKNAATLMQ